MEGDGLGGEGVADGFVGVFEGLGGVEEAGDGGGDVLEEGAEFYAGALEAVDGEEVEGVDCEVADGEGGHCAG